MVREVGIIVVVLVAAAGIIGGAYALANHGASFLQPLFAFGQPTPVPTLTPTDALNQIHQLDPVANVSVSSPLADEVDLVTVNSVQSDSTFTTQQQTQILSLYLRGYAQQTFWRWTDEYPTSGTTIVYEVHASELWVITLRTATCSSVWAIWDIPPTQIIARGVSGGDFTRGTSTHLGSGTLPDGLRPC
jgi:hypothetical protein